MCISIHNHISFTRKSFSFYRHQGGNVWNRNAEVMDKVDLSQTGIHNPAHQGGKEVSLSVLLSLGGGSKGKRQCELHSVVSASHISHKCCGSAVNQENDCPRVSAAILCHPGKVRDSFSVRGQRKTLGFGGQIVCCTVFSFFNNPLKITHELTKTSQGQRYVCPSPCYTIKMVSHLAYS